MSVYFEKVSRFKDIDLPLPKRATANSAGYDFVVAEDIVIPPYEFFNSKIRDEVFSRNKKMDYYGFINPVTLDEMATLTKELKAKVTLVSTGVCCHLEPDQYLELSLRSSTPLKHWIVMANSIGVVDSDFYPNEIMFPVINFSPIAIQLKRGDRIGQGIVHSYCTVDNESTITSIRTGGFGSTA